MTNVFLKSHSYTINLANVLYIKQWDSIGGIGTRLPMKDERMVQITCPYDEVMRQIARFQKRHSASNGDVRIIELDY